MSSFFLSRNNRNSGGGTRRAAVDVALEQLGEGLGVEL